MTALLREDCATAATDARALEPLRGARVLVTGGTGFMGTWIAQMVATLNDEQGLGIELLLLSPSAATFTARVPWAARRDIAVIEADVRDIVVLPEGVTHVIHAAGTPDNRVHVMDPLRTMSVISHGTSAVLQAASRCDTPVRVLNVSSGLIYGPQPMGLERIPETHVGGPEPDSISSVYAEAKRYAEAETAAWRSTEKLQVVVARPFAFMGPYQGLDKPWAVNNFLRDALLGGPIRITGDAETVRSYLYPSDMAFWLLCLLAAGVPGTAYNVGSPEAITLGDLAGRIAAAVPADATPEVVCRPLGAPRPTRFVPDVSRAVSALGLRVTVDLDRAIERTLMWHRAVRDGR